MVAGTLVQGTLLLGLTAGISLASDIEGGFFDRLLTAPVQRASLVLGRVTGTAVLAIPQAAFFLTVAFVFGARYEGGVGGVLLTIAIASLTAAGLGGFAAAIALRTGSLSLLQNLFPLVFMLLFTAPAFFPRALLAPAMHAIAPFNPLTYVVEGMRAALHGTTALGDPWLGLLVAAGLAVATTTLAVLAMRSRLRSL